MRREHLHLRFAQLPTEQVSVLDDARRREGFGDGDDAALDLPLEQHLRHGLAVPLRNRHELRLLEQLVLQRRSALDPAERAVRV